VPNRIGTVVHTNDQTIASDEVAAAFSGHVGCFEITGGVMSDVTLAILIAAGLAALLWIPYLIKEIRDGKREFGPLRRLGRDKVTTGAATPTGAADYNPGRAGDPAPGQPDAQADPYASRAQRNAPPIKS
jgi:hypothetical protein